MIAHPASARSRVLVVDNEPDICRLVARTLEVRGIPAACASSCDDALALMRAERFAAAVVDLGMPYTDGLNCAGKMKLIDPDLRLFAFTAYSEAARPTYILRDAGFDDCFRKAADEERLFAAVEGAVARLHAER
jgi:CheY-like chemotaxis protein